VLTAIEFRASALIRRVPEPEVVSVLPVFEAIRKSVSACTLSPSVHEMITAGNVDETASTVVTTTYAVTRYRAVVGMDATRTVVGTSAPCPVSANSGDRTGAVSVDADTFPPVSCAQITFVEPAGAAGVESEKAIAIWISFERA
jgi:hypothetical protein